MTHRWLRWWIPVFLGCLMAGCHFSYASLGRVTAGTSGAPASLGGVHVERGGAPIAVTPDLALEKGDIVQTDGNTTAVIRFAGGTATLAPNTKVTISSIWTWFGRVFFSGDVDNDTRYTGMAVDGTAYLADVQQEGKEVTVTVLEGRVTVRSKVGQFAPVAITPGQRFSVGPNKAASTEAISQEEFNDIVQWVNAAQAMSERLVPDLRGRDERSAVQWLQGLGFSPRTRKVPAPRDESIGKVVSHSPGPGGKGRTVTLDVGARSVLVVDLRGMTVEQARAALPAGLSLGSQKKESTGNARLGTIIRQSPAAGQSVLEGSHVDIVVEALLMPDLRGQSMDEALPILERLRIEPRIERQPSPGHEAGTVVAQTPPPGAPIEPGSAVTLTLATESPTPAPTTDPSAAPTTPPPPTTPPTLTDRCTVPDVRSARTEQEAVRKIAESFQPVVEYANDVRSGEFFAIEGTNPQAGTRVACGDIVRLYVVYSDIE